MPLRSHLSFLSSWGGAQRQQAAIELQHLHDEIRFDEKSYLPYGLGRSYGDSVFNQDGCALKTANLKRFIAFDEASGELWAEAGLSLREIFAWALPRGYFLPVSPGTQNVTLGGAIANDIHGKNHHVEGNISHHVTEFLLLRSSGERLVCSGTQNPALFRATVGGLGLTGLILWVKLRLKKVAGPWIEQEQIKFSRLRDYFDLSAESHTSNYVVSWIDCLSASRKGDLKGIFIRGDHSSSTEPYIPTSSALSVPFKAPISPLNTLSIKAFNILYYAKNFRTQARSRVAYDAFFHPLDRVHNWNRLYGRAGLLQYQSVIPPENAFDATQEMLQRISRSGQGSFLGVLKNFGSLPSLGYLSFAREGTTLALDFKNTGASVQKLFSELDQIVLEAGGALYPAKDARMSAEVFDRSYPHLKEFVPHKDPKFSSDFWRRVYVA